MVEGCSVARRKGLASLVSSIRSWSVQKDDRQFFFVFFPKALRRVLPENPLNTYTSTLTLTHTHTLDERKHPSAKYASGKVCKCKYASMICKGEYASTQ